MQNRKLSNTAKENSTAGSALFWWRWSGFFLTLLGKQQNSGSPKWIFSSVLYFPRSAFEHVASA